MKDAAKYEKAALQNSGSSGSLPIVNYMVEGQAVSRRISASFSLIQFSSRCPVQVVSYISQVSRMIAGRQLPEESPHSTGQDAGETPGAGQPAGSGPQKHTAKHWMAAACCIHPVEARVKWWCKRPPVRAAMPAAGQPPSGARPSRDEQRPAALESRVGCTELARDGQPRQMIISAWRHRMRLTGWPGSQTAAQAAAV